MESSSKIIPALNILRRLPPSKIRQNIAAVATLRPELQDEILQRVDQPLELEMDTQKGEYFFKSEFNRDGDSYRSPYTNTYFPPLDDAVLPSPKIRLLEEKAQILFSEYLKLYYEGGIVNTFFWDKEDGGFAGCVLIKKECEKIKGVTKGVWDSLNVFDVKQDNAGGRNKQIYKITSTVVLEITMNTEQTGEVVLSGNLTKQREESYNHDDDSDETHLARIGKLVEEVESSLRSNLENVYFGKTKEIAFSTRFEEGHKQNEKITASLRENLFAHMKKGE
jgi:capping protein beta